ncbi:hypothetical protein RB2150_16312 [Rhodobacterales bacterium HTCC2150]|nr:hypothetical protein RB2150_16312 [Rhodobacterales bacterium HTCC2150] [Rhodobacteraceae bacterium HTCC2150]
MTVTLSAPVSVGELLDKITILELKTQLIPNPTQVANAQKELDQLRDVATAIGDYENICLADIKGLRTANHALWHIEEDIRKFEDTGDFGERFVELARAVYKTNDQRAAFKRNINLALGSDLIEEKSY